MTDTTHHSTAWRNLAVAGGPYIIIIQLQLLKFEEFSQLEVCTRSQEVCGQPTAFQNGPHLASTMGYINNMFSRTNVNSDAIASLRAERAHGLSSMLARAHRSGHTNSSTFDLQKLDMCNMVIQVYGQAAPLQNEQQAEL